MGTASLVDRPEGNRRPETNPEAGKLCIGAVAPYQLGDAARTENSDFQHRDLAAMPPSVTAPLLLIVLRRWAAYSNAAGPFARRPERNARNADGNEDRGPSPSYS
jgi:hypothetical protein